MGKQFQRELLCKAQDAGRTIVLPEGTEPRVLQAAAQVMKTRAAKIILLGEEAKVKEAAQSANANIADAQIMDPMTSPHLVDFVGRYHEARAHKGISVEDAVRRMVDVSYFGTMLVQAGLADGMVSGAVNTTAHTIRPALEFVKTKPGISLVSSCMMMCLADRVVVFADCAVNPNPDAEGLASIAISSAATAQQFGLPAKVAMLSYSTGTSGSGPDVDLVRAATEVAQQREPGLCVDGPLQFDAAIDPEVGSRKAPGSKVAGQASVFVFPNLSAGNIAYKAVQRLAGALVIGPVLQGLNKPVNDVSRGASVADLVNTILMTSIQAGAK
jgi:phosphate acetyltransferase